MKFEIEKARRTGFCFGVKRAVDIVTGTARERGHIETLGAVVHNEQVMKKLGELGVETVKSLDDVKGKLVVTSSHGVSPEVEETIRARGLEMVSTRCGDVKRAQDAAKRLVDDGFFIIVFGDAGHPEVKGILGWLKDKGMATVDEKEVAALSPLPKRIGVLSQTTQIASEFTAFAQKIVAIALRRDSEIRIIDTICHDLRDRQATTLDLAKRVDLMLIVGGRHSANSNHLASLCATEVKTFLIETAADIDGAWLEGVKRVGVGSGSSTAEETIDAVIAYLKALSE
jgi:4-hydroxy-3-methylbut-2-en-1-yl diphosphate reductase